MPPRIPRPSPSPGTQGTAKLPTPATEGTTAGAPIFTAGGAPSRRAAMKALATGAIAWPVLSSRASALLAAVQQAGGAPALQFLSPAQYAAVDAIAEAIVPADARSPGARAARVADYVDLLLAESPSAFRAAWTEGLAALEAESQQRFGLSAGRVAPADLDALLTVASRNEASPSTALERFFAIAKEATIRGYYTSEIGIQKELEYKGNQILLEFQGCTHPEHGYVPPAR